MTPIVSLTLAYAAGDLAGLLFGSGGLAVIALLTAGATLGMAAGTGRAGSSALVAAFAFLGAGLGAAEADRARHDCRAGIRDGTRVLVVGVFDGVPGPGAPAWLRAEEIRGPGAPQACRGVVRVRLASGDGTALAPGAHVWLTGSWWSTPAGRWPVRAERRGSVSADSVSAVSLSHGHPLLVLRTAAQQRLRSAFREHSGLAEAMVLARREALDVGIRDRFAAAGLAHMLAISGAHVGIIAGTLLLIGRVLRLRAKTAALVAVAGTVLYVLFLGAPAAAARAGLQAVLVLATRLLQRPADPLAMLAVAALVLLAADGMALLDPGFQLSFAGMYGILAWREPLRGFFTRGLPSALATTLAVTLAATLATAPIAALHFGTVPVLGPLTNVLAGPVIAVCIPAVSLVLGTSLVSDAFAEFLAGGARVLLTLLDGIAARAAAVPGGHQTASSRDVMAWLMAALVATLVARRAGPARAWRRRLGNAARPGRSVALVRLSAGVAAWLLVPLVLARGSGTLELHAIDVGQGDAIAIRLPAGRWILVDAGPRSERFDAGRAIVVPYLLRHGARRLDALILSHPDEDHIGGAAAVLERLDVDVVIDPGVATGKDSFLALLRTVADQRIPWIAGRDGRTIFFDDVTLHFLAPEDGSLDALADANDYSLVFRLEYGRFSALFTGDAPRSVENRIAARSGDALASTLLKVGHHGSRTSTGDSVLTAAQPRIALLSVGRRNRYGHPAPEVMARLRDHEVQVLRTDLSGTVRVRVWPDGRFELGAER